MPLLQDLLKLWQSPGFRRLFTVRLVSQAGDGLFQAGLATLFLFSPEKQPTAGAVALAFAVLLLPFTVVGPFVGPLLDRWRRRTVLVFSNALRAVLTVLLAFLVVGGQQVAVYVLALIILAINRFGLAALSAGQPLVVDRELLVVANSLTPTLGAVAAVAGAGIGVAVGLLCDGPTMQQSLVLLVAAMVFISASGLALRIAPTELGPTDPPVAPLRSQFRQVFSDLAAGASYLVERRTPALAIASMGFQRFVYGVSFLLAVLISRNLWHEADETAAALADFSMFLGLSFIGNALAVVLTPVLHRWVDPMRWIALSFVIGAGSQVLLSVAPTQVWLWIAGAALGFSVQGTKIAVDTIVQRDSDDTVRGRAFSLYDMTYNASFVVAAGVAALVLPETGWSPAVFLTLGGLYIALAAAYARVQTKPVVTAPRHTVATKETDDQ